MTLRPGSDWASFSFESAEDFDLILDLAGRAAEVYLPQDGSAPKPPPTGAAMERRKRWH